MDFSEILFKVFAVVVTIIAILTLIALIVTLTLVVIGRFNIDIIDLRDYLHQTQSRLVLRRKLRIDDG